jgi:hypothetical protein
MLALVVQVLTQVVEALTQVVAPVGAIHLVRVQEKLRYLGKVVALGGLVLEM